MSNKRLRNWLQNAALLLLTASALFQMIRLPLMQNVRMSPGHLFSAEVEVEAWDVPPMFSSVNLMVTGDSEYGRCGRLCAAAEDAAVLEAAPLFQEALGSAVSPSSASDVTLRRALENPGFYLEFTCGELPLEAVAAWLGEEIPLEEPVNASALTAMALTAEGDGEVFLFLLDGHGRITRCATALPGSAVRSVCENFTPNGAWFAYETSYTSLSPYTVLTAEVGEFPDVAAERPAGYSAYNLLTALDFNAHTLSRYTESGGAEVVEESPRTLRIGPDGQVSFISRGYISSGLYRASGQGMQEALSAGWRLAAALTEGTGASPLFLHAVEETEDGYTLRFRYEVDGVPVFFSGGDDALSVTFQSGMVASFSYRCRSYTPLEEDSAGMLPPAMAQAIAAGYPDAVLSIGYEDDGSGQLAAQWYR